MYPKKFVKAGEADCLAFDDVDEARLRFQNYYCVRQTITAPAPEIIALIEEKEVRP